MEVRAKICKILPKFTNLCKNFQKQVLFFAYKTLVFLGGTVKTDVSNYENVQYGRVWKNPVLILSVFMHFYDLDDF